MLNITCFQLFVARPLQPCACMLGRKKNPLLHLFLWAAVTGLLLIPPCAARAATPKNTTPKNTTTETVVAEPPMPMPPARQAALLEIARRFVASVGGKFDQVDAQLGLKPDKRETVVLPEGETLFFNIVLPRDLPVEGIVSTSTSPRTRSGRRRANMRPPMPSSRAMAISTSPPTNWRGGSG